VNHVNFYGTVRWVGKDDTFNQLPSIAGQDALEYVAAGSGHESKANRGLLPVDQDGRFALRLPN
jgi:hypothetical protein